jgi:hypothetical protein
MKPKLLLRIAAVAILIHILGHMMGHSKWKEPADPVRQEVVRQMLENKAPFMGSVRSMGDYYEGYSLCITATLIMMMLIAWSLSGTASENPAVTSKALLPLSLCLIAFSVVEFIYFFAFAASISLVAGVLVGAASLQLRKMTGA